MIYRIATLLACAPFVAANTCGDLRTAYSDASCCAANPHAPVDSTTLCHASAPRYTGNIDRVIAANSPCDGSTCFNRYNPAIPHAITVTNGSVVRFETTDLWDKPGWDYSDSPDAKKNMDLAFAQIDVVHILTGPVGVEGAEPGDKLAIEILDIQPLGKGFTMAGPGLGFLDDALTPDDVTWVWWDLHPDGWHSPTFPNVVVPYHPFPGTVAVMPSNAQIDDTLRKMGNETTLYGGPAWPVSENLAVPASVCGAGGSHKTRCLRTLPPGSWFGNTDSQRMMPGTTLLVECGVSGCGVGIGDVHGAQGDGEVSITAIEFPAAVTAKLTVVKPSMAGFDTPTPAMAGTSSITSSSPSEFISFMGLPTKEQGFLPSQYRYLEAMRHHKLIPESMSLAARNALLKCITFLMTNGGYTFGQALVLASATADLRVAQVVDKPMVGMEAILHLNIFKGELYTRMKRAAFPFAA